MNPRLPPQLYEMGDTTDPAKAAEEHHESLFRWALSLAAFEREEAMEIVQQTYLELMEGKVNLASARDPKRFLFGVARRIAASRRRKRAVWGRILRLQLKEAPVSHGAEGESRLVSREEKARLARAVGKLPQRQREVLHLVFAGDMTVEEAARVMGVSVGSARTHYHRGKKRVAEILENSDE